MTAAAANVAPVSVVRPGWEDVAERAPRLATTLCTYLDQIAATQRPATAKVCHTALRRFAIFVIDFDPRLGGAAELGRRHIEAYKIDLARPRNGKRLAPATTGLYLGTLRMFFLRITEWDWDDAPARVPIFLGDLPHRDEPLPRFLDDGRFTQLMRTVTADPDPLRRLVVELLARTGMRVGELCTLEADAVVRIGETHWLRVPVGKLHNDRYIPLHPQLLDLLDQWRATNQPNRWGLLIVNRTGRPLNQRVVGRMLDHVAARAGIGRFTAHQLRHTLATQAINRGMSLEAIAALLGHRSLNMTRRYARIADRTVVSEYEAVSRKVEALYDQPLPADAEGPTMRRLRAEHQRMLGNGHCNRPAALDCSFENICETCVYYSTGLEFRPVLLRQRRHAERHGQTGRAELFARILDDVDNASGDHRG